MCGDKTPPVLCFERWLIDNMLVSELAKKKTDPLIASAGQGATSNLQSDLIRAEISEEEALKITKELVKEADESKAIIKAAMKGEKGRVPVVIVNKYKHTIDLMLSNDKSNLLKLNHEHYNKLSALWRLAHDKDSKHIGEPLASSSKEEKLFHDDLYSLVLRYVTLQGPGF